MGRSRRPDADVACVCYCDSFCTISIYPNKMNTASIHSALDFPACRTWILEFDGAVYIPTADITSKNECSVGIAVLAFIEGILLKFPASINWLP